MTDNERRARLQVVREEIARMRGQVGDPGTFHTAQEMDDMDAKLDVQESRISEIDAARVAWRRIGVCF